MEIDHVLIRVGDLDAAAAAFDAEHGLGSVAGGRHPGWGTANRIVPLGSVYLELLTVVDEEDARATPFGRWVANAPTGPIGWCVRTDSIEGVAERLGLAIRDGSRATPDGGLLRWRLAGLDQAAAEPSLPFFIDWDVPSSNPGRSPVQHRSGPVQLAQLELRGDTERIAHWLDGSALPISIKAGEPSVARVVLANREGPFAL